MEGDSVCVCLSIYPSLVTHPPRVCLTALCIQTPCWVPGRHALGGRAMAFALLGPVVCGVMGFHQILAQVDNSTAVVGGAGNKGHGP